MSDNGKARRATAQNQAQRPGKSKGKPSFLQRILRPACGGLMTSTSPAATMKELERIAAELEYADEEERQQEEAPRRRPENDKKPPEQEKAKVKQQ